MDAAQVLAHLQGLDLLESCDPAGLARLAAKGTQLTYAAGDQVWDEGDTSGAFQMLVEGRIEWSRTVGGQRVVLAIHEPVTYSGAIGALSQVPMTLGARALDDVRMVCFPARAFRALCVEDEELLARVVRLAATVSSANEGALRQRERLASLGTMAAGLAHEIGNPAAAALNATRSLEAVIESLAPEPLVGTTTPLHSDALARADAEEALADALERTGVAEAYALAAALADSGLTADVLERVDPADLPTAVAGTQARALVGDLRESLARIVHLTAVMSDFSHLDQAPDAEVDVLAGVRAAAEVTQARVTLVGDGLPRIAAHPSELNQAWAALLANATAADPGATIEVRAVLDDAHVRVEVVDHGPGMEPGVLARATEPFFTTRDGASGLGLDRARRIVEDRHGGRLELRSRPGVGTTAVVLLPVPV